MYDDVAAKVESHLEISRDQRSDELGAGRIFAPCQSATHWVDGIETGDSSEHRRKPSIGQQFTSLKC